MLCSSARIAVSVQVIVCVQSAGRGAKPMAGTGNEGGTGGKTYCGCGDPMLGCPGGGCLTRGSVGVAAAGGDMPHGTCEG
eukprot:9707064-Heterocapsa_arctica.AAC.1